MEEKSFEVLMNELEEIVEKLENGELALEESVELFEKGVGITKACAKILDGAQQKVTMLVQKPNGDVSEESFAEGENA